jgi:WS/DGAT/MGAT family acyltransferase
VADKIGETRFEHRMSPGEALMWNVERDPWLNPNASSVSFVEGQCDFEQLRRWVAAMVADVPRLRERVQHGVGRLTPPTWVPDPEFDFDYHVRHLALPAPGSERQFLDLVGKLHQEPYDRTRPPWMIIAIDGLEDGQWALVFRLHHTIADGYGQGRLQERFMMRDPDRRAPDPVNLQAIVAHTVARARQTQAERPAGPLVELARAVGDPAWALSRRLTDEAVGLAREPQRVGRWATSAQGLARRSLSQVSSSLSPTGRGKGPQAGSPLWTGRSGRRHLELLRLSLDEARRAGQALGGSLNDVFMTAMTNGAVAYHEEKGSPAEVFNTSFVVSTRSDAAEGGNSFTPLRVQVPAGPMSPHERFRAIQARVNEQRDSLHGGGLMGGFAAVVNLLPTSVTTRVARSSAAHLDFATTNVRGFRVPRYITGQRLLGTFAPGPVAGAAMIVSLISYIDAMFIGFTIDPTAVEDPAGLRRHVGVAFEELFSL